MGFAQLGGMAGRAEGPLGPRVCAPCAWDRHLDGLLSGSSPVIAAPWRMLLETHKSHRGTLWPLSRGSPTGPADGGLENSGRGERFEEAVITKRPINFRGQR